MRWSQMLIPTTREAPKDATRASHALAVRAGLIRAVAPGLYTWLPTGTRILRRLTVMLAEALEDAGAEPIHTPAAHPANPWHAAGRWDQIESETLRFATDEADWRSRVLLSGPTEELAAAFAAANIQSYRQLPAAFYQCRTRYRVEAGARYGLLGAHEYPAFELFACDVDANANRNSSSKLARAVGKVLARCGLPHVSACAAPDDSAIDIVALAESGETHVVLSDDRNYIATLDWAQAAPPISVPEDPRPIETVHTPGCGRVEDVCQLLGTTPNQMIKTLIYTTTASAPGDQVQTPPSSIVALVRGDHEVNLARLQHTAGSDLQLADAETIRQLTGAEVGFAGPQGLIDRIDRLIVDPAVAEMRRAATGANKTDYHVLNIQPGRDFPTTGDRVAIADIRLVQDGDRSPLEGRSALRIRKGIRLGTLTRPDKTLARNLEATYLDAAGQTHPVAIACLSLDLGRLIAAAIEIGHDDDGILWSPALAPFEVEVLALDPRDVQVMRFAQKTYERLTEQGVATILDDRDERAGSKFKDADLLGAPLRVIVGKKGLAQGGVEVATRREKTKNLFAPDVAVELVLQRLADERQFRRHP